MTRPKIPDKIAVARLTARQKMPYFGSLLMAMHPVESPGIGTMAVDQFARLYWDPRFLEATSSEELALVVLHEVEHLFYRHCERLREASENRSDAATANIAKDLAVNSDLMQSKFAVPDDWMKPERFGFPRGLAAEEYYEKLRQQKTPASPQEPCRQQRETHEDGDESRGKGLGEEGRQGQQPSGQGNSAQRPEDHHGELFGAGGTPTEDGNGASPKPDEQNGGNSAARPLDRSQGEGGSSHDGQPRPWELPPPERGAKDSPPGYDRGEMEILVEHAARQIEEHERQKGIGSMPGGLSRQARKVLHPAVDPVDQLAAKVRFAVAATYGYGDYTYRKPSRRQPPGGALLPCHRRPIPSVLVIADTSGSMGENDMGLALGVVARVIRKLPDPRGVEVWTGDTHLETTQRVFRPEQVMMRGGGGTDMRAMIRDAMERPKAPNVVLVVTDGWTPWPDSPVKARVIACLTRKSAAERVPPWIDRVILYPER
jgi:predicted metal-dependent peptidase